MTNISYTFDATYETLLTEIEFAKLKLEIESPTWELLDRCQKMLTNIKNVIDELRENCDGCESLQIELNSLEDEKDRLNDQIDKLETEIDELKKQTKQDRAHG